MAGRSPTATWRVLLSRDFGPYFAGNLLSNCGTWFQNIAQAILVYRLTHSALLVGVVNFAQFAGIFALAPWAGSAADHFDRRRLLIATQIGATAVSGGLALAAHLHHATAAVTIAFALVLGLTTAFALPAGQAIVPLLVDRDGLPAAVALNSLTYNLARAIGPVLGALVVNDLGIAWAFALNSLSYLALVGGIGIVHPAPQRLVAQGQSRPRLRESVGLVAGDARLLALFGVIAAVALSADPVNTLTPSFARELFHHPDTFAGVLVGAFGAGSVLAAVTVAGRAGRTATRLAVMLAVMTAGMAGFAGSSGAGAGLVALAVGGFGFLAANTGATTIIQLEVDDAQRGRVMALWSVAFLGVRPFGSLIDGATASATTLRLAVLLMTVPALVAMAGMTRLALRQRRHPTGRAAWRDRQSGPLEAGVDRPPDGPDRQAGPDG